VCQHCAHNSNYISDGACDDGGPGSGSDFCAFGTDCADCGSRAPSPPPSPPVFVMSQDCAATINTSACTEYALICLADRRDGYDKCIADGGDTQVCRADALQPSTPDGIINDAIAPYLLDRELSDRTKQLQALNRVVWQLYKYVELDFTLELIVGFLSLFYLIYCCLPGGGGLPALKAFAIIDMGISLVDLAIEARVLSLINSHGASVLSEDFTGALCFATLEYNTATIMMTDNLASMAAVGAVQIFVSVLSILLSLVVFWHPAQEGEPRLPKDMKELQARSIAIVLACVEAFTLIIQMGLCTYDYIYNAEPLTTNFIKAIGGFVGEGTCVSIGSTDACDGPLREPYLHQVLLNSAAGDAAVFAAMLIIAIATFGFTLGAVCKGKGRCKTAQTAPRKRSPASV